MRGVTNDRFQWYPSAGDVLLYVMKTYVWPKLKQFGRLVKNKIDEAWRLVVSVRTLRKGMIW